MVTIDTPTPRNLDVLAQLDGDYVASLTRKGADINAHVDPEAVQRMVDALGIHLDVSVRPYINHEAGLRGQFQEILDGVATVIVNVAPATDYQRGTTGNETATDILWHELSHVLDYQTEMDLHGLTYRQVDNQRRRDLAKRADFFRIDPQREYETRPDEVYAVQNQRRMKAGLPDLVAIREIHPRRTRDYDPFADAFAQLIRSFS